jgi:hypothetical protein
MPAATLLERSNAGQVTSVISNMSTNRAIFAGAPAEFMQPPVSSLLGLATPERGQAAPTWHSGTGRRVEWGPPPLDAASGWVREGAQLGRRPCNT